MYMVSINKDMVVQEHGNICSIIIPKTFNLCLKPLSSKILRKSTTQKVLSNPIKGPIVPIKGRITPIPKGYIEGIDHSKDLKIDHSKDLKCISRYYLNECYRFFSSNVVLDFIFCGKNPLPLKKSSGETLTISGSV